MNVKTVISALAHVFDTGYFNKLVTIKHERALRPFSQNTRQYLFNGRV